MRGSGEIFEASVGVTVPFYRFAKHPVRCIVRTNRRSAVVYVNYAHLYHAGNFADVHKHLVLTALLTRLSEKPSPWFYLDTHAGEGLYTLKAGTRGARGEFETGVGPIFHAPSDSNIVRAYQSLLHGFNPEGILIRYPGSPLLAASLARPADRMIAIECVPERAQQLRSHLGSRSGGVHCRDGYEALGAFLPPKEQRGVILIDPPYESIRETQHLLHVLPHALSRFPRGIYVIWHPFVDPAFVSGLRRRLQTLGRVCFLDWLTTRRQGLRGSGLAVFNMPYRLGSELEDVWHKLGDLYKDSLGPVEFTQTGALPAGDPLRIRG